MSIHDVMTVDYWKRIFWKIRTKDAQGVELPDEFFQAFIDMAVDHVETILDIKCSGSSFATHSEKQDVWAWEVDTFYLKNLKKRPLQRVTSFSWQLSQFEPLPMPAGWVEIASRIQGQVQIKPNDKPYSWTFRTSGFGGYPNNYGPGMMVLQYLAGFEFEVPCLAVVSGQNNDILTIEIDPGTDLGGLEAGSGGTFDFRAEVSPGQWIKVGNSVRRIAETVSPLELRVGPVGFPAGGPYNKITLLKYDPALLTAIGWLSSIPAMEVMGTIVSKGVTHESLGLDAMRQTKGYAIAPGTGIYASQQRTAMRMHDIAMMGLAAKYRPVNVSTW